MSEKETISIRRYGNNDLARVKELHYSALQSAKADLGLGTWDNDLDEIEKIYLNSRGDFLVGILNNQIIAIGALLPITSERAEVKRMRIDPAFQRRGFGQIMLNALECRAKELGFRCLELDTLSHQTAARHLYENAGFMEVRRGHKNGFECVFYQKEIRLL